MIDKATACVAAWREIELTLASGDPLFSPWRKGTMGEPVLVHDVFRRPTYWLIPLIVNERAAGFVRVLGSGRVTAIGTFYQRVDQLDKCPLTVTGIDAAEASRRAVGCIDPEQGERASTPLFVHDGPPGREAWLVEVRQKGRASRWLFVTSAGVYERSAGETLDSKSEE